MSLWNKLHLTGLVILETILAWQLPPWGILLLWGFPIPNMFMKNRVHVTKLIEAEWVHIDGLVQDCSNSIANALELLHSCTKPWICHHESCSTSVQRQAIIWIEVYKNLQMSSGGGFNIKMPSYQYRKSHYGGKKILWPSYLHNGISYTGKMTSSYWIRALPLCSGFPG